MIQIRHGVFETNSSSTHSITMCTEDEFKKWKKGKMLFNSDDEELVEKDKLPQEIQDSLKNKKDEDDNDDGESDDNYDSDDTSYLTYKEWEERAYSECLETFESTYTSPKGEKIVAFGKYGRD